MLTIIEKVIVLQNIEVFAEVPTEQLSSLAAIAEEVMCGKGEDIFRANDSPDALYLVLTGKVVLHRDGQEIELACEKQTFGVWALFDDKPRMVTATAEEESHLLRIDREDFIDLLADHVQIAEGVLKTVVKRLRSLAERVTH